MLDIVSKGFKSALNRINGQAELTQANIEEAVRDVRISLLEADVELGVVKGFIERVRDKAIGRIVQTSVTYDKKKRQLAPADHFIAICEEELRNLLGGDLPESARKNITFKKPITTIMMIGLQGVGKTTTTGKLAHYLIKQRKKPLLVAADIYRPAAVQQLKVLGEQLNVPVYYKEQVSPPDLCVQALSHAKELGCDVVIFDTAGRLAIDDALMHELENIQARIHPDNEFLVVDAMSGQDAIRTAAEFSRRLKLSGFIMTKLDGDARGGAALSIRSVTGKPILFLGMGETLDKLEEFRPEGLASRILGMGDIVGLVKDFEAVVDQKQAEKDAQKMLSGQFSLNDFLEQLRMIQKMGPIKDLMEKMPLLPPGQSLPEGAQIDDKELRRIEAMIQSMTPTERLKPEIMNESRYRRIAKGSGTEPQNVKEMLERFLMMRTMMSQFGQSSGLLGKIPGFKQLKQLKQLKNMNLGDMFSGMPGGIPGMGGGGQNKMPGLPKGYHMPGSAPLNPMSVKVDSKDKKAKRKAEKTARKKSRK